MSDDPRRQDVTLVIPVFNALDDTIACVTSILEGDGGDCPILLHDDGSPAYVGDRLRAAFADIPNVEVRTNFRNRGYTANIQYGVDAARTPYVAVINSDTLFPRQWLHKLAGALDDNPLLAAVGPMSNAASYQNLPALKSPTGEFSANPDFGITPQGREAINLWLETGFGGLVEDIPILNGFCTLFRTRTLREVGGFDQLSFPTGYGEENDLCMRLMMSGARLGVRLDCFVHHLKSRSFGSARKREYSRAGREALARLYGAEFVPAFAKVMDNNGVLNGLRYATAAAFGEGDPAGATVEEVMGPIDFAPGDDVAHLFRLSGPCTAVIWPDRVETGPADPAPPEEAWTRLTLGSDYVRLVLPEGRTLTIGARAPVDSALGACAVWSHLAPLVVDQLPVRARSPAIRAAMETLRFRFLYFEPDIGTPMVDDTAT